MGFQLRFIGTKFKTNLIGSFLDLFIILAKISFTFFHSNTILFITSCLSKLCVINCHVLGFFWRAKSVRTFIYFKFLLKSQIYGLFLSFTRNHAYRSSFLLNFSCQWVLFVMNLQK